MSDEDINISVLIVLQQFVYRFCNWLLIFGNFIPISLLVTLEMVKFMQAMFINRDKKMVCKETGITTTCNTSNLNEELG